MNTEFLVESVVAAFEHAEHVMLGGV